MPNGYPVWIDVAQASIGGAGTAMRFVLPLHAHNLPLMHRLETKLVVALKGELDVRVGRQRIALLKEGDAIKLGVGVAHRIHQHGMCPSTVLILLPPAKHQVGIDVMLASDQRHRSAMLEGSLNDLAFELKWEVGTAAGSTGWGSCIQDSVH